MNIEELKQFILWCKENRVKTFSKDGIHFELSDLAFIQEISSEPVKEMYLGSSKSLVDTSELTKEEEEELLYWSSK